MKRKQKCCSFAPFTRGHLFSSWSSLHSSLSPQLFRLCDCGRNCEEIFHSLWLHFFIRHTSLSARVHMRQKRISILASPLMTYDAEAVLVNCISQLQIAQRCFNNHGWQMRRWSRYRTKGRSPFCFEKLQSNAEFT